MHWLPTIRWGSFAVGLLLLVSTTFLYENEEGQLQNRCEAVWVKIDDLQKRALSAQAAFLSVIAGILQSIFDKWMGPRSLSLQCICAVAYLFYASECFGQSLLWGWQWVLCGALMLVLSGLPGMVGSHPGRKFMYSCLLLACVISSTAAISIAAPLDSDTRIATAAGFVIGVAWNLLFVGLNRWSFRRTSLTSNPSSLVLIFFCNVVLTLLSGWYVTVTFRLWRPRPGLMGYHSYASEAAYWLFMAAGGTLIVGVYAGLIAVVTVVLLMHRLIWPVISRPIYQLQRRQLLTSKGIRKLGWGAILASVPYESWWHKLLTWGSGLL